MFSGVSGKSDLSFGAEPMVSISVKAVKSTEVMDGYVLSIHEIIGFVKRNLSEMGLSSYDTRIDEADELTFFVDVLNKGNAPVRVRNIISGMVMNLSKQVVTFNVS